MNNRSQSAYLYVTGLTLKKPFNAFYYPFLSVFRYVAQLTTSDDVGINVNG
ncbi:hypothetical protein [Xenorhabdus koppenhoeferi]|uniref:hypothetical protein n=1 Tax=Xenorhabdus koppenhoeferi TaxID=351659 RepID=UPI002B411069|nr:hypothetical protein [Xenorhabdus sp. Vera]